MRATLQVLSVMDRAALGSLWNETFKQPPPPSTSQDMMRLIIGWEIQAKTSRADVKALKTAIKRLPSKASSVDQSKDSMALTAKPRITLSHGTRLSREWQGRTYIVDVLDKGFAYQGKLFSSLSPIAKAITGTHRSGPLFFGVSA